jgi:hypothetical protein
MLGNYQVAIKLVASQVVLNSMELVSSIINSGKDSNGKFNKNSRI